VIAAVDAVMVVSGRLAEDEPGEEHHCDDEHDAGDDPDPGGDGGDPGAPRFGGDGGFGWCIAHAAMVRLFLMCWA